MKGVIVLNLEFIVPRCGIGDEGRPLGVGLQEHYTKKRLIFNDFFFLFELRIPFINY